MRVQGLEHRLAADALLRARQALLSNLQCVRELQLALGSASQGASGVDLALPRLPLRLVRHLLEDGNLVAPPVGHELADDPGEDDLPPSLHGPQLVRGDGLIGRRDVAAALPDAANPCELVVETAWARPLASCANARRPRVEVLVALGGDQLAQEGIPLPLVRVRGRLRRTGAARGRGRGRRVGRVRRWARVAVRARRQGRGARAGGAGRARPDAAVSMVSVSIRRRASGGLAQEQGCRRRRRPVTLAVTLGPRIPCPPPGVTAGVTRSVYGSGAAGRRSEAV